MESWNVLSKPIGILTVDDVYEVIVPKSTPYPTPEPIIQTFRTAQESQRAVRIPIFHAEINEFNPKDVDQWIGAADINLEGAHLPAETRVDVGIAIDRDGCLDIEARIQDGSGRRQRVFIDPHIGLGKQPGSINGDQEGAAEQEAGETTPEWEVRLQWSIDWAEIAMHNYEWLFSDHRVTQTLQRLVKEANEALARKDETSGRRLEEEIDGVLEKEFKGLMLLLWAEMRCLNRFLEPAQRSQGRSLIKDICDGIRQNGSVPELQQKMKQLNQWLTDTRNVGPEQASEGDTRLKR
jgi:molecular chaperone DnaK (HSP70)